MKNDELIRLHEAGFKGMILNTNVPEALPVKVDTEFNLPIVTNSKWEIKFSKTPVTFLEAVQAFSQGNIVRCVLGEKKYIYNHVDPCGEPNSSYFTCVTSGKMWGLITWEEILNGVWSLPAQTAEDIEIPPPPPEAPPEG